MAKEPAGGAEKLALIERQDSAFVITLNRPDKLNAINEEMATELMAALDRPRATASVLAVILQGNERAFCAGADLSGFSNAPEHRFDNYRARYNQREDAHDVPAAPQLHQAGDIGGRGLLPRRRSGACDVRRHHRRRRRRAVRAARGQAQPDPRRRRHAEPAAPHRRRAWPRN